MGTYLSEDRSDIDSRGYRAWLRQVPCDGCGAAIGTFCTTGTGAPKPISHASRRRLRWDISRIISAMDLP